MRHIPDFLSYIIMAILFGMVLLRWITAAKVIKLEDPSRSFGPRIGYGPVELFIPFDTNKRDGESKRLARRANYYLYLFWGLCLSLAAYFILAEKKPMPEYAWVTVFHDPGHNNKVLTIVDTAFRYPVEIKRTVSDSNGREILLAGHNPYANYELEFRSSGERDTFHDRKLYGYFSGVDTTAESLLKLPLFYVLKWEYVK